MDLLVSIDADGDVPLQRQLYGQLRRAILAGRLSPGHRLPSTRLLADSLQISRTTVSLSYEELLSEGYIEARRGSGTFVCSELPEDLLRPRQEKIHPVTGTTRRQPALSAYGIAVHAARLPVRHAGKQAIRFDHGTPDFDAFPTREWARLISRYARSVGKRLLDYSPDMRGFKPLREALASYLARSRAVKCDPDQILILNGSQQALDLISRITLDRGDTVALEDPGYLGAQYVFKALGAKLKPVPVDEAGMKVDALRKGSPARLVYVTPSHQFPTGAALTLGRRLELINWAAETGSLIIEDDYDSGYRYGGRPIPALQGLDQTGSVIYVGTFSKVLFPALRIAYLVAPADLTAVLAKAHWLAVRQSPFLEQQALAEFLTNGRLERHIRAMRKLYGDRRQALVNALVTYLGDRVTITGENAGMHLLACLRTNLTDDELVARADAAGVGLSSAAPNYLGKAPGGQFLLGFAALSPRAIREGIRRLATVLDQF